MTANDNKSYLGCLNKLVDEYNNSYHCSIGKEPIHADYSALPEELESSFKASKFIVDDRVRITKYKNIFTKDYTEKWSKELFVIDSVLKTILVNNIIVFNTKSIFSKRNKRHKC